MWWQAMVRPSRAAVPLEVLVVWSFLYLALRRVLELMVLCWRSADAKGVEILVLRHQLAILRRQHPHAPGSSPKTARCWRRSIACCPGRDGRPSWSRPRRRLDGTAAWCAGTGPIQPRHAADHPFPARCRP
jgi:hypothetical protein